MRFFSCSVCSNKSDRIGSEKYFFDAVKDYCAANDIPYREFDDTVPAAEYGTTGMGLRDFFHFNNSGHVLLATALDDWTEELEEELDD